MQPKEDNSLEQSPSEVYGAANSLENPSSAVISDSTNADSGIYRQRSFLRFNKLAFSVTFIVVVLILLMGGAGYLLSQKAGKSNKTSSGVENQFATTNVALQNLKVSDQLQVGQTDHLAINGQLQVNSTLVLLPTSAPA